MDPRILIFTVIKYVFLSGATVSPAERSKTNNNKLYRIMEQLPVLSWLYRLLHKPGTVVFARYVWPLCYLTAMTLVWRTTKLHLRPSWDADSTSDLLLQIFQVLVTRRYYFFTIPIRFHPYVPILV